VDEGVLELVLLLVVEDHAVVVHEVQDARLPERPAQELHQEIVFPFLRRGRGTSSAYCCALDLGGGFGTSSFFFPNSHSNIDPNYII
jgi:hypothetical protein